MKTTQRLIICNRAPLSSEDGWIHIVPKGELPNREAGIVQVLDETSLDSILANIEKDKNRLGDKWPGIYAGREHFIYDSGKDSAALGWFKQFQKRPNGIWANDADLTPEGMQAVKNRSYKFTSFVADPADLEKIEDNKYRVKKIETVGFTNFSNGGSATREGHGLLDPVINRSEGTAGRWVTVDGAHILIKSGESVEEAVHKTFGDKKTKPGFEKASKAAHHSSNTASDHSASAKDAHDHLIAGEKHREAASMHDMAARYAGKNDQARSHHEEMAAKHRELAKHHENANRKLTNRAGQMPAMPEDGNCPDDGAELEMNEDGTATCPTCKKNFADPAGAGPAANQPTNTKKKMKNIATKLGLAAEASEEAILAEVTKIQNRVTELEPLATENTKLKNRITEVDNAAVDNLLAAHGVKDAKVLNRLKPVIQATPEADRATALIEFGFKPGEAAKPAARVLNRGSEGAARQQAGTEADTQPDEVKAKKIMNRARALMGEVKHLSLADATKMASDEIG